MTDCTENHCLVCPNDTCHVCAMEYYYYSNYSCISSCNLTNGLYEQIDNNGYKYCLGNLI